MLNTPEKTNRLRRLVSDNVEHIIYAGVVGSSLCRENAKDIDVTAVVREKTDPRLIRLDNRTTALAFDTTWLTYKKHLQKPVGLIPSILFRSIELSSPLIGDKNALKLPIIRVCKADYLNLEIKKNRYRGGDRKQYLTALIFEKLLKTTKNLEEYQFDRKTLAKGLRLIKIEKELESI